MIEYEPVERVHILQVVLFVDRMSESIVRRRARLKNMMESCDQEGEDMCDRIKVCTRRGVSTMCVRSMRLSTQTPAC
jgi:hypothetical protein